MQTASSIYFGGDDPLALVRMREQNETSLHEHEFHELVVVFAGRGVHFTDDEDYDICSGDVFLVLPGISHGYRDTMNLDIENILYLPGRIGMPLSDLRDIPGYQAFFEFEPKMRRSQSFRGKLNLDPASLRKVAMLVSEITRELNSNMPGKNFASIAYFMQIVSIIARKYSNIESDEGKAMLGIADLISHIEKNHTGKITLPALAKFAGMSKSSLYRNFLAALGIPPVQYLIRTRMEKAAEVLRNSRANVTEAAFASGFNDSNYFVRQFRRHFGITPGKYRQLHQSGKHR
ncbi:MAG: helix-turn-helix domain-containing protein [Victivallales bacterium]|nr:helix-turn-helix domain-containing protein [Victivallales bacterium]